MDHIIIGTDTPDKDGKDARDKASALEARIRYLEELNRFSLDALDLATSLGDFQSSVLSCEDPVQILHQTASRLTRLIPFSAMAFYLVSEGDSDFVLRYAAPEESSNFFKQEIEYLIDSRHFAWALGRRKPVIVSTSNGREKILLHAVATSAKTRGMFLGAAKTFEEIPDISFSVLSSIMQNSANAMESSDLYRLIREMNERLNEKVERLATSEDELCRHRNRLQELVDERTSELEEAVARLKDEVRERKAAEEALQRAEEKYRDIVENAIEGIFQAIPEEGFISANPALARILGFETPGELIASGLSIRTDLFAGKTGWDELEVMLAAADAVTGFEAQVRRKDGQVIWASINCRAVWNKREKRLLYFEGSMEDISEKKHFEMNLERKAHYDDLTGLPNRTFFHERFDRVLAEAKRLGHKLAVLYIDLDMFKGINDTLGHHMGDLLLRQAARRLMDCVKTTDIVARQGGDEFLVILSKIRLAEDAQAVADKIRASLSEPYSLDGFTGQVGASIGISVYPMDGTDPDALLRKADQAMYTVKERGRGILKLFLTSAVKRAV